MFQLSRNCFNMSALCVYEKTENLSPLRAFFMKRATKGFHLNVKCTSYHVFFSGRVHYLFQAETISMLQFSKVSLLVQLAVFPFVLLTGIEHLCEGTCKLVEAIGKGLCNVLDVAVGFLKLTEMATAWVGAAINFLLTAFRINRYEL